MNITWYAHSCFLIEDNNGTRILTDPCDPQTGYTLHDVVCDAVTMSHHHHDHNYAAAAIGKKQPPVVFDECGSFGINSILFSGYPTWHDDQMGAKRGANIIFCYTVDGMRVVHLGDLGHPLGEATCALIGQADVLLAPVGAVYTINAAEALRIADQLKARVLIPMHYETPELQFKLESLDVLLNANDHRTVERLDVSTLTLSPDTLGENRIVLLRTLSFS